MEGLGKASGRTRLLGLLGGVSRSWLTAGNTTWKEKHGGKEGGGAWHGLFEGLGISYPLGQSARYIENAAGL